MLDIHADQVYTIGVVAAIPQPVVVNARLRNVPERGVYNWEPGAHLGIHRLDTVWFAPKEGEGEEAEAGTGRTPGSDGGRGS